MEQEKNKRKYCSAGGAPRGKLFASNWLEGISDVSDCGIVEVTFKNTRVGFYTNPSRLELHIGDIVAVEGNPGHDIGRVSMVGRLVRLQMRKNGVKDESELKKVFRIATQADMEKFEEARSKEHSTMIRTRKIAEELELNMKIGDVEYQGDGGKAIFYYIADERVDFRKLIRILADTFKIRVEMKQIGARQEAGRIGGIGACGRELCCASWVSSFSSVTTNAARVQEISLNPQKLAGQCSKLKCCLMYEYDVYADARQGIPRLREPLQALDGEYYLVKTDILAHTMSFSSSKDAMANVVTIPVSRVKEILALNRAGKKVDSIADKQNEIVDEEPTFRTEEDSITRFDNLNKRRRNKGGRKDSRGGKQSAADNTAAADENSSREGKDGRERRNRDNRNGRRDNAGRPPRRENAPESVSANKAANGDETGTRNNDRKGDKRRDDRRGGNNRGRNGANGRNDNAPRNASAEGGNAPGDRTDKPRGNRGGAGNNRGRRAQGENRGDGNARTTESASPKTE